MPDVTVKALKVDEPGNSLAAWFAAHHPDLFLALFKKAQAANMKKGIQKLGVLAMGRLGDDGITTTFDAPATDSFSDPGLTTATFNPDYSPLPSNLISDAGGSGSSFLSSVANGVTSAGSTIGDTLASFGTSVLGALGSVGSWLGTPAGQSVASTLVKIALPTGSPAQQTAQTQVTRVSAGNLPAPLTYTTTAQGQVVPVYATNTPSGTVYQPVSPQGLASLTPSSVSVFLNQYGLWIAVAGLGILGLSLAMRR